MNDDTSKIEFLQSKINEYESLLEKELSGFKKVYIQVALENVRKKLEKEIE